MSKHEEIGRDVEALAAVGAHFYLGEHGYTWFDDSETMLVLDEPDFAESARLALVAFRAETRFNYEYVGPIEYDEYRAALTGERPAEGLEDRG